MEPGNHGEGSWIEAALISGEVGDLALSAIEVLANMGFAQMCTPNYIDGNFNRKANQKGSNSIRIDSMYWESRF